jgi:ABC-type phosphate transport system ATPase subunit
MAAHDLNQASRLGDELVHIHTGRIVECASSDDFFERSKNDGTQKFINQS